MDIPVQQQSSREGINMKIPGPEEERARGQGPEKGLQWGLVKLGQIL